MDVLDARIAVLMGDIKLSDIELVKSQYSLEDPQLKALLWMSDSDVKSVAERLRREKLLEIEYLKKEKDVRSEEESRRLKSSRRSILIFSRLWPIMLPLGVSIFLGVYKDLRDSSLIIILVVANLAGVLVALAVKRTCALLLRRRVPFGSLLLVLLSLTNTGVMLLILLFFRGGGLHD